MNGPCETLVGFAFLYGNICSIPGSRIASRSDEKPIIGALIFLLVVEGFVPGLVSFVWREATS